AQQAIDSPLLEVSIDGARGILFNVIGGNDLSMHEINTAAETITNAADPDANIIFGATINPELDGEIIITVVATGFDASYFADRSQRNDDAVPAPVSDGTTSSISVPATPSVTRATDSDMSAIDMSLDDQSPATDFKSDNNMPNIWAIGDNDDGEGDQKEEPDDRSKRDVVLSSDIDEELEKPSFLRRLAKRVRENPESDKTDKND
ncbi:MAG: hypothetical protein AAB834_07625, partial [Patescibacteria group bacterium]